MSKPSPTRYRTTTWSDYTASLKQRGSLLVWLDKDMAWLAPPDGRPGRPALFSDAAIQFCLTIKILFKLPLRQIEAWERHWSERPWRGGIKFLGDGEWQARKHGVQGRRQWRKVHLAMDTATSDIRAIEFTPSSDGDSPVLPELLDQILEDEEIGTVTAEIQIRIALMNRFNALGTAEIVRVA